MPDASTSAPLLQVENLDAFYGDFQALFGVSLEVNAGETVAIIGANGAGKSTLMCALTGLVGSSGETVRFNGVPISGRPAHQIVRAGLAMVPEGRKLFPSLSVEENLLIATNVRREGAWTLEKVYQMFPVLEERKRNAGTALSGGQQQMVAIGRALMSNPKLLLCDEISLGLAPIIIRDIYQAVPRIKEQGTTMVIVEQDINQALAVADRIYCMQEGRISLSGRPDELTRDQITAAYFGLERESA